MGGEEKGFDKTASRNLKIDRRGNFLAKWNGRHTAADKQLRVPETHAWDTAIKVVLMNLSNTSLKRTYRVFGT